MEKSGHNQFSGVGSENLKRPVRKKSFAPIMAQNWGVNPELPITLVEISGLWSPKFGVSNSNT